MEYVFIVEAVVIVEHKSVVSRAGSRKDRGVIEGAILRTRGSQKRIRRGSIAERNLKLRLPVRGSGGWRERELLSLNYGVSFGHVEHKRTVSLV